MIEIKSVSVKDTEKIGETIAKRLTGTEVLALYGSMGMGKTAFVRGLARGLAITEEVSSPTFALVHEYRGKFPLYHFDMYRVASWEDLYSTGFFDDLEQGILVIEWSENIEAALEDQTIRIRFRLGETENERIIIIEGINAL